MYNINDNDYNEQYTDHSQSRDSIRGFPWLGHLCHLIINLSHIIEDMMDEMMR